MAYRPLLITNNPLYLDSAPAGMELKYFDASALDVLISARDLAHKGWIMANHPLYGNFRPHQQPYRSVVMLPPDYPEPVSVNEELPYMTLHFLEEALSLYQSPVRKCLPEDVPEHMRKDCALIDRELLRATLENLS